nr:MAG TPA: Tubulin-tyrosine ligase family [Caudoviricetes sp.]
MYCIDKQGNIWSYEGNASIGQAVTLKIYDNHTSDIKDDIIKGVKTR